MKNGCDADFALHDLSRVRLLNASTSDIEAVRGQLGFDPSPVQGQAAITLRFVPSLESNKTLRLVALGESAFSEDAFFLLSSRHRKTRIQLPLATIGEPCEIICETGLTAVPLLIPILNLTIFYQHRVVPLHASAFIYKGKGVLVTGWSKGGKTESLLSFMRNGASYIGDEWVYISADGKRLYGIPEPIRVWDWHLKSAPDLSSKIKGKDLTRLNATKAAIKAGRWIQHTGMPFASTARRSLPILSRSTYVDVKPAQLFGKLTPMKGPFDRLLFLVSHNSPKIEVLPISGLEVANRMVFSLAYERQTLLRYYLQFRFAFPERHNPRIDTADTLQLKQLKHLLSGKDAHIVSHPYPVSLASLYSAIEPVL